jgi:hypothetical protein
MDVYFDALWISLKYTTHGHHNFWTYTNKLVTKIGVE